MFLVIIIGVVVFIIVFSGKSSDKSDNKSDIGSNDPFWSNIKKARITLKDTMRNYELCESIFELGNVSFPNNTNHGEYFMDTSLLFSKRFIVDSIELLDKNNKTISKSSYSWRLETLYEDDCGLLKIWKK